MQQCTTSKEFIIWRRYLLDEANEFHREDYYLAAIATEVARSNARYPGRIKLMDRILKFKFKRREFDENAVESAETKEDRIKAKSLTSKKAWFGVVGLAFNKVLGRDSSNENDNL